MILDTVRKKISNIVNIVNWWKRLSQKLRLEKMKIFLGFYFRFLVAHHFIVHRTVRILDTKRCGFNFNAN
jgi:hypothetical protein